MKLATLQAGQFVETGGEAVKGDGGQARYLVTAGASPDNSVSPDLANGNHALYQGVGAVNDLSQSYIFDTVAAFKASLIEFPDGKIIHLLDRGADFTKITGIGTANTFDIIASTGVNQSVVLIKDSNTTAKAFGAVGDDITDDSDAILEYIASFPSGGVAKLDKGTFYLTKKLSLNVSGLILQGAGVDLTELRFRDDPLLKTAVEINNGSWDDTTNIYTSGGASISGTSVRDLNIVSVTSSGSTGVVLARATKQCFLRNVKVVGFSVCARFYGSWYASAQGCTFESGIGGARMGYETNNFIFDHCDFTSNVNYHLEGESVGTCRGVGFNNCAFDGLPAVFGVYLKGFSTVGFYGSTYFEGYSGGPTTPPFLQCGTNVVNLSIDTVDLILPEDNSYTGTAVQLGVGPSVGVVGANISNFRQYNSATGTAIDCTFGAEVEFGGNVRMSSGFIGTTATEIIASDISAIVLPETTTTDEVRLTATYTKRPFGGAPIRITANFSDAVTFAGQRLRVYLGNTSTVLLDSVLPTVVANETVEVGVITGLVSGVELQVRTYKVGSSITWPTTSIIIQQL